LVNFYQTTRRYNPEDSHLRTHRRENLKSYFALSLNYVARYYYGHRQRLPTKHRPELGTDFSYKPQKKKAGLIIVSFVISEQEVSAQLPG
jgi:hypothetical protein